MKYLITGGAGFIGSTYIKHLNDKGITNIDILETKDFPSKWENLKDLKFNDIYDLDQHIGVYDVIVDFGAFSQTYLSPSRDNYENNLNGVNLMGSASRIIFISSASVYGNTEDFSEDSKLDPTNFYAFTKMILEKKVKGSNFPILRLFNVYGERESLKSNNSSSPVYKALYSKIPFYYDTNYVKRDFVYVGDVCDVIDYFVMIPLSKLKNQNIINVGSGQARTFKEVADIARCEAYPKSLEQIVDTKNYQYYTCADLTLLRKLGYDKPMTTLEEGIRKMKENS